MIPSCLDNFSPVANVTRIIYATFAVVLVRKHCPCASLHQQHCILLPFGILRKPSQRWGKRCPIKAINSSSNHFCLQSSEGFTKLTSSIYQNSFPVTRGLCTDITQLFPACNIYTQRQGLWWEKEHLKNCVLQMKQTGEWADRRVFGRRLMEELQVRSNGDS